MKGRKPPKRGSFDKKLGRGLKKKESSEVAPLHVCGYLDVVLRWAKTSSPTEMCCVIGQGRRDQYYISSVGSRGFRCEWNEPCTFIVTDVTEPYHLELHSVEFLKSTLIGAEELHWMILQDEEKHEITLPVKSRRKGDRKRSTSSVVHMEVQFSRSETKGFLSHYGFPISNIPQRVNTGDILLFDTNKMLSKVRSVLTSSKWNHVAMVICVKEGETYVLEALLDTGVALNSLSRITNVIDAGGGIGVRHLTIDRAAKGPEIGAKLQSYLKGVIGRPYEQQMSVFMRAGLGKMKEKADSEAESRFCSQLIAETYIAMGLLNPQKEAGVYLPRDFDRNLDLLNGRLEGPLTFRKPPAWVARVQFRGSLPSAAPLPAPKTDFEEKTNSGETHLLPDDGDEESSDSSASSYSAPRHRYMDPMLESQDNFALAKEVSLTDFMKKINQESQDKETKNDKNERGFEVGAGMFNNPFMSSQSQKGNEGLSFTDFLKSDSAPYSRPTPSPTPPLLRLLPTATSPPSSHTTSSSSLSPNPPRPGAYTPTLSNHAFTPPPPRVPRPPWSSSSSASSTPTQPSRSPPSSSFSPSPSPFPSPSASQAASIVEKMRINPPQILATDMTVAEFLNPNEQRLKQTEMSFEDFLIHEPNAAKILSLHSKPKEEASLPSRERRSSTERIIDEIVVIDREEKKKRSFGKEKEKEKEKEKKEKEKEKKKEREKEREKEKEKKKESEDQEDSSEGEMIIEKVILMDRVDRVKEEHVHGSVQSIRKYSILTNSSENHDDENVEKMKKRERLTVGATVSPEQETSKDKHRDLVPKVEGENQIDQSEEESEEGFVIQEVVEVEEDIDLSKELELFYGGKSEYIIENVAQAAPKNYEISSSNTGFDDNSSEGSVKSSFAEESEGEENDDFSLSENDQPSLSDCSVGGHSGRRASGDQEEGREKKSSAEENSVEDAHYHSDTGLISSRYNLSSSSTSQPSKSKSGMPSRGRPTRSVVIIEEVKGEEEEEEDDDEECEFIIAKVELDEEEALRLEEDEVEREMKNFFPPRSEYIIEKVTFLDPACLATHADFDSESDDEYESDEKDEEGVGEEMIIEGICVLPGEEKKRRSGKEESEEECEMIIEEVLVPPNVSPLGKWGAERMLQGKEDTSLLPSLNLPCVDTKRKSFLSRSGKIKPPAAEKKPRKTRRSLRRSSKSKKTFSGESGDGGEGGEGDGGDGSDGNGLGARRPHARSFESFSPEHLNVDASRDLLLTLSLKETPRNNLGDMDLTDRPSSSTPSPTIDKKSKKGKFKKKEKRASDCSASPSSHLCSPQYLVKGELSPLRGFGSSPILASSSPSSVSSPPPSPAPFSTVSK